ncbi:unnamed protein product, partial [Rotaria magnacalcarata]
MNSSASSIVLVSTNDREPNEFMHISRFNQSNVGVAISKPFQDDYKIPSLPNAVIKDIEQGKLEKFGPHCANRQILIDAIVYDLRDNYNLFYPTHKQFDDIGNAIVKYLQLPLTKQNATIWKDALQTELKRQRFEHRDNQIVQEFRLKYSRTGSGRPVKRKIGETAKRDRYKQMVMISCDDQASHDIQEKSNQLRDLPTMDINAQLNLWKETLFLRRKCIRDKSTADIMKDFPGYSNALLEPVTPYPALVFVNGLIHVYVDFIPILSTNSPDDAVSLLLAMYTIFELAFDKKSRTIRLLYSIVHEDKRFLSNSIRILIKEKNIDIYYEQQLTSEASTNSL